MLKELLAGVFNDHADGINGHDNERTREGNAPPTDHQSQHHNHFDVYDEYSSDEETYLPADFELPALNDKNIVEVIEDDVADTLASSNVRQSGSRKSNVPRRDYYSKKTVLLNKGDSKTRLDSIDKYNTKFRHTYDDHYNKISTGNSFPKDTPNIIPYITRKKNLAIENKLELRVMNAVISNKDVVSSHTKRQRAQQAKRDALKDKSTLIHPGLDSLEEKLEDLRNEKMEHWAVKHGKHVSTAFTTADKRKLRTWFKQLDYDKSGEVNVDELQDVLLSSGILKTREQIKRVLTNADKNNTFGIDFEEFISALRNNTIAHSHKLKKVEELNKNKHAFEMETLIGIERRKKLTNCIVKKIVRRQKDYESAVQGMFDESKSRKERDNCYKRLPLLEEAARIKIDMYDQFVDSLEGVLELCRTRSDDLLSQKLAGRGVEASANPARATRGRGGVIKVSMDDISERHLDISPEDMDELLKPPSNSPMFTNNNHPMDVYK